MRRSPIFILAVFICGLLAFSCGGDIDDDLSPVHVRVYNTDVDDDFEVSIGTRNYGTVLKSMKSEYKEFEPLGNYTITITDSTATTTLNTGSGGIYTLTIDNKDDADKWKVTAD